MAHAVPGPGSAPDAQRDWFAEFAEEAPQGEASPPAPADRELERIAPEPAASESRLTDRSSAIDDWSTASATPMPEPPEARADWRAFRSSAAERPAFGSAGEGRRSGRTMRLVALAAGVIALVTWWVVPRLASDVVVPQVPPRAAPPPALSPPAAPPPPPITAAARASAPPAATSLPAPPPATPEALAARAAESPAIEATLGRYRAAFGALDASRVVDVWPGADRAALERTFDGLSFQSLEFEQCAIDVRDRDAQATCRGRARVVTKAATKTFLEPRRWQFTLRKDDRGWVIREVR